MDAKGNRTLLVALNTIGLLVTLVMNTLASVLPLNGLDTGTISDSIPNLFVPAGLTFSVWGIIYTLLIIFIVYQIVLVRKKADAHDPIIKIGYWFFISCIANSLWIVAWHWQLQLFSIVMMLVLLGSLIIMHTALRSGNEVPTTNRKIAVYIPISVYLGWITVATIANFTSVLVVLGWNRFGLSEVFWTVLVIIVAIIVNVMAVIIRKDIWFALVGFWAILGIYLKRSSVEVVVQPVVVVSLVGLVLIALVIVYHLFMQRKDPSKRTA